ncbi:hypothetical protein DFJ73DRAFT_762540 [Zopfochytrium polystomum]|nr:hypothetical protein DFJ73DRAFT_762540 [Zopfochytrium polystomum]
MLRGRKLQEVCVCNEAQPMMQVGPAATATAASAAALKLHSQPANPVVSAVQWVFGACEGVHKQGDGERKRLLVDELFDPLAMGAVESNGLRCVDNWSNLLWLNSEVDNSLHCTKLRVFWIIMLFSFWLMGWVRREGWGRYFGLKQQYNCGGSCGTARHRWNNFAIHHYFNGYAINTIRGYLAGIAGTGGITSFGKCWTEFASWKHKRLQSLGATRAHEAQTSLSTKLESSRGNSHLQH